MANCEAGSKETLPWEQQPGETNRAYAAFVTYCEPGPLRSLRTAAGNFHGGGDQDHIATAGQLRQFETWSSKNRWVERSHAFDGHEQIKRRKARNDAIEEMDQRHINTASCMQDIAFEFLRNTTLKNPADAIRMELGATRLERDVRGETTEHVEVTLNPLPVTSSHALPEHRMRAAGIAAVMDEVGLFAFDGGGFDEPPDI